MAYPSAQGLNVKRLGLGLTLTLVFVTPFILTNPRRRATVGAVLQTRSTNSDDLMIDDFEDPNSPAPWTFSRGAEFPGATGTLSAGLGHHGRGAHLAYDFTGGGAYVSADFNLPAPLNGTAIGFWVRSTDGCWLSLRVRDVTGQVLQYELSRPLEAIDPNAWYQQIVELDAPNSYFGGADDGILHDGIAGLSILAGNFAQNGSEHGIRSAIDFDEVTLIRNQRFDLDPFDASLTPTPPGGGNLMANLGVNIHFPMPPQFAVDTRALDAARDAGFSWVRMDLFWSDVETKRGAYNFSNFDKLVTALEARGMKALFILDYSNLLHSDCPRCSDWLTYGPQSPSTIKAFGDYAEAAARHFAGNGVRYEVWNEPNWPVFWKPIPDSNQYAALAKEVIARVHAGDAQASISTGGVSGFDFDFLRSIFGFGGAQGADSIAVHPYRLSGPETATDELAHLRSISAWTFHPDPPIWETEWGYSSTWSGGTTAAARNTQAAMVVREILAAKIMGFPLAIYYDIRDDGTDPANAEHNFGLLANDYGDKPAIHALRTLKSFATNRTFVGSLATQPTSLHALRLDGSTDTVVVLWSDQPGAQVSVSLPVSATAFDMFGSSIATTTSSERIVLSVSASSGPIYVTVPETRNPIDNVRFFVTQQYRDFLNREPDQEGLEFWTNEISACGSDRECTDLERINVSAAYFLAVEFQHTGYLVERMYKAAYGDADGTSMVDGAHRLQVPIIHFNEFLPDTKQIGQGVVVGQTGWEIVLENNQRAFATEFVQRSRFSSALPTSMTPAEFVDKLFLNAAVAPSAIDLQAAISEFGSATSTSDLAARARALRDVAENSVFNQQEFNRAFVLMQFFGYLRRDPNSGPDSDYSGYDFWLTKLNAFNGNFVNAEMVKAFITSGEYRQRFGP